MTFQADKYQELALKTFNGGSDPVRHALLGLAGEAGELLELYKKHEYKPGFSWWDCKICGQASYDIFHGQEPNSHVYVPKVLDELGDWFYYARIVTFQAEISFEVMAAKFNPDGWDALEDLLDDLVYQSIKLRKYYRAYGDIDPKRLQNCVSVFLAILNDKSVNVPLKEVTELNYAKLNSAPGAHGWKK